MSRSGNILTVYSVNYIILGMLKSPMAFAMGLSYIYTYETFNVNF